MPRIVRDIQLLVNDNDDHLYGYRLSDGTEVRIGTSRPDNAAAVVGATTSVSNITRNADGAVSGYTWCGVTYAVTYHPSGFGIQTVTGGGKTTTVSYNSAGQITGVTYA